MSFKERLHGTAFPHPTIDIIMRILYKWRHTKGYHKSIMFTCTWTLELLNCLLCLVEIISLGPLHTVEHTIPNQVRVLQAPPRLTTNQSSNQITRRDQLSGWCYVMLPLLLCFVYLWHHKISLTYMNFACSVNCHTAGCFSNYGYTIASRHFYN